MRLHVITERDVGLFSLVQQVIANIPWALAEHRTPVVHFGNGTCYWTPNGHHGRRTVWEYYFEPVIPAHPAASIPEPVRARIAADPPPPPGRPGPPRPADRPAAHEVGGLVGEGAFVSSHFGDHPRLRGGALAIPYRWDDPSDTLRREAKGVIDEFIRPRAYILRKVDDFFARHLGGHTLIGVPAQ